MTQANDYDIQQQKLLTMLYTARHLQSRVAESTTIFSKTDSSS